jgi:hypothetical protein
MFERVMAPTEVCKVVWSALTAVFPSKCVVDIAPSHGAVAAGKQAVEISCRQVSPKARGWAVAVGGDDRSVDRVGEYTNQFGCHSRQLSGCVEVDGPATGERRGLVALTEKSKSGDHN